MSFFYCVFTGVLLEFVPSYWVNLLQQQSAFFNIRVTQKIIDLIVSSIDTAPIFTTTINHGFCWLISSYASKNSFKDGKRQKTEYSKSKTDQMFSFMVHAFKEASNKKNQRINQMIKSARQMKTMHLMMMSLISLILMTCMTSSIKMTKMILILM
jgi:hypothetical protein